MDAIIQYEIIIFRRWNQFGNHYRRAYKRLTNAQKTVKKIMQDARQHKSGRPDALTITADQTADNINRRI